MKNKWKAAVAGLALLGLSGAATARDNIEFSITIGTPGAVYAPAPAYVYAPPPRVYYPAPVVYAPAPRVVYYGAPGWKERHVHKRHPRGHAYGRR